MKTKAKFLQAGIDLFGSQGYSGTGLKQIVAQSGATWGSVYHFFPGGKDQLGAEAVMRAAERDNMLFAKSFRSARTLKGAVTTIFKSEMKRLSESDYRYGCAVASVASDVAATSEEVRQACSDAFGMWQATLSEAFREGGVDPKRADVIASMLLSALEGATLLARTHKSIQPMKDAMSVICELPDVSS